MKKLFCVIIALITAASFTACGSSAASKTGGSNSKTVSDVLNATATASATATAKAEKSTTDGGSNASVDVDLTKMNSTMVYSEVYNMMQNPADYRGKTVKMSGTFSIYQTSSRNYYACLIADATACCSQGIEFVWKGTHSYPKDYPELGTEITVVGTFGTYLEGTTTYCQLNDATLTF